MKRLYIVFMIMALSLTGCSNMSVSTRPKQTEPKAESVEKKKPESTEAVYTAEPVAEPAKEPTKEPAKEPEYLDVDSVDGTKEDYGDYEVNKDEIIDKYYTEKVPAGKPKPVEPEDVTVNEDKKLTCYLKIECTTILNNINDFNKEKKDILPNDGIILEKTQVEYYEGESVFDVLLRETKNRGIHMEYEFTPIYNSSYIEGIANIYEFDCGALSGWMYEVNGWAPNYGVSRYQINDGDVIEFRYTCDLGKDLGYEQ